MASTVLLQAPSVARHESPIIESTPPPTMPVDTVAPKRPRAPTIPYPPPPVQARNIDPLIDHRKDTPFSQIDLHSRPPPPPYSHAQSVNQDAQDVDAVNSRGKERAETVDPDFRPPSPKFVLAGSGDLIRNMRKTVTLRDKVAERRIGLEVSEGHYMAQWRHTSNHLDDFIAAATRFMDSLPADVLPEQGNEVRELWKRLQHSSVNLNKWQNEGLTDVYALTKLESNLATEEEHLYDQLRLAAAGPNVDAVPNFEDSGSESTIEYGRLSEPSLDPLEEEYYDIVGDLHLLREYIFNVDADQHRRTIQREQALQSGSLAYLPAERHTFEKYVADRQQLITEFFEKKKEMERLKVECLDRNFKIEEVDWPSFNLSRNTAVRPYSPNPDMASDEGKGIQVEAPAKKVSVTEQMSRVIDWRDSVIRANSEQEKPPTKPRARQQKGGLRRHFPPLSLSMGPRIPADHPSNTSPNRLPPPTDPVPENPDDAIDEASFTFGKFQGDDRPGRRYSEPNLSELPRLLNMPSQSPKQHSSARSEGDVDALSSLADTQDPLHSQNWLIPPSEPRDTDS